MTNVGTVYILRKYGFYLNLPGLHLNEYILYVYPRKHKS